MNSFRTEIDTLKSAIQIDYSSSIFLLGSCFAQNIGSKLKNNGFDTMINPFGVLYNPLSVINTINKLLSDNFYSEKDLGYFNKLWYSFDHYTGFSRKNKNECLEKINNELNLARAFLKKMNILIITFGTSWIYNYKETNKIVANCHKIPSKKFERIFIKNEEIVKTCKETFKQLLSDIPDLKIILTVSPVRHLKNGAVGNLLSKSNLIIAVHKLVEELDNVEYFPSYEIMMDDLRDYRFYNEDMLHPNIQAIDYIWDKFINTYINKKVKPIMEQVVKINQATCHNPNDPASEEYKSFIKKHIEKAELLNKKHQIKLDEIILNLRNKLI